MFKFIALAESNNTIEVSDPDFNKAKRILIRIGTKGIGGSHSQDGIHERAKSPWLAMQHHRFFQVVANLVALKSAKEIKK